MPFVVSTQQHPMTLKPPFVPLRADGLSGAASADLVFTYGTAMRITGGQVLLSQDGRDPVANNVAGNTRTDRAQFYVANTMELNGFPNDTWWNQYNYAVNTGDAGTYAGAFRVRARAGTGYGASINVFGNNVTAHAQDLEVGMIASKSDCTGVTNGSNVLTGITITSEGSVFDVGMPVHAVLNAAGDAATYVPSNTTITGRTGPASAPTSLTLSNPITGFPGGTLHLWGQPGVTFSETIGILVTGSGSDGSFLSNKNGVGMAFQAYSDNDRFLTGISMGASAVQPGGKNILIRSSQGARGISFENADNMASAIVAAGTSTYTGPVIQIQSGVSAQYGISVAGSFTNAGLLMTACDIATDTATGMKIAQATSQKLGFWGATPIAKPAAVSGSRGANAALADLLTKLASIGLISDSTT